MASLPRSVLRDMLVTRYIPNTEEVKREELETVRAGCSVLQPKRALHNEDLIEGNGEDVELVEDENYQSVHRIDETPKLIVKRQPIIRDEAAKVLNILQKTPVETLRTEKHDYFMTRWFHTSRDSEKELVEYVLLHPNHRPYFFAMQCRQLPIDDLPELILKSLLSEPKETGQSLARFAIRTTTVMPFHVLYELLENMVVQNEGFQISDEIITASITPPGGNRKTTRRLQTKNCKEYGELEPDLDEHGDLVASTASITCSVEGKRHVQVQITYANNSNSRGSRIKFIELEQTVRCMNRRVLIVEEPAELVEFEVEKDMIPLKDGVPPVEDLISYLRSFDEYQYSD
ncbi:hypothetical protein B9Z55_009485 [Caenorhabditis nigoni]|uniref:Uncharacterized protein n=1 Tax=Caenorhabditis nigoni TaxID=1611254 RepID=A0A2G5USA3_9PELO|nr:hypothetical protein B9Z55_009485 [Caenorhabditis nigoni]